MFIDQRKRQVRILRRQADDDAEEVRTAGTPSFESLGGVRLQVDWLFVEPRPDERATADSLLDRPPAAQADAAGEEARDGSDRPE
jgi:hypothetical protein